MSLITSRVTRGVIRKGTTKAALVLAVAGSLYFTEVPVTPVIPTPPTTRTAGSGGAAPSSYNQEQIRKKLEEIRIEDSEIIAIVELTLKHFTL